MSLHLLDTDWVIDCLNGEPNALSTIGALEPDGLALSVVSYGELYDGAYYARDPVAALAALRTFQQGKELMPVTPAIAERFGILRGALSRPLRTQIGNMDLLIAATAIEHDLTLVTRNLRDFSHIPGLKLYRP